MAAASVLPGRPYLDGVDVRVLPLGKSTAAAVADGDADLGEIAEPVVEKEAEDKDLGLIRLNLNGGLMLIFNTRKPPFNDPAARHAVVDSLDSAEMNRTLFGGLGTPAKGPFDANSALANVQLAAPENRPDQAAAAFRRLTADGTRPFRFTYLTIGAEPGTIAGEARYIQQRLERHPNVRVAVESVDTPGLIGRIRSGDFDMALSALWMADPEPALYDFLFPGSPSNTTGYSNPAVTEAMNAARKATDIGARRDAYVRVQVQLNQDLPFWVYREAVNTVVFDRDVTGVQPFGDGVVLFDRIGFRE
ncbi:ABC transporter substrate-binding protein [Streptomycetaceae bacterium NBC_01309]